MANEVDEAAQPQALMQPQDKAKKNKKKKEKRVQSFEEDCFLAEKL